jgi:hypothetical protein
MSCLNFFSMGYMKVSEHITHKVSVVAINKVLWNLECKHKKLLLEQNIKSLMKHSQSEVMWLCLQTDILRLLICIHWLYRSLRIMLYIILMG